MEDTLNNFIGYEYRDITVRREMQGVYLDGYKNFGWLLDTNLVADGITGNVTFKLKRDRKIRNKAELTRLQLQFEAYAKEIEALERSKKRTASAIAITIGAVGTAFMAGSVFAVTSSIASASSDNSFSSALCGVVFGGLAAIVGVYVIIKSHVYKCENQNDKTIV